MPHYRFDLHEVSVPGHMLNDVTVDYGMWVARLHRFIRRLRRQSDKDRKKKFDIRAAPPLSTRRLKSLQSSLDFSLPDALGRFLSEGASEVCFKYEFGALTGWAEPFCSALQLKKWRKDCLTSVSDCCWIGGELPWAMDRAFWRHAIPLACFNQCDYLALWAHDSNEPNPPVLFLNHEGASWIVAPSFSYFLHHWERLGYLSVYRLQDYCDPGCGYLDSTTDKAAGIRQALGIQPR